MKIIPGNNPVTLDGNALRSVECIDFVETPKENGRDIYAVITIKIDSLVTSNQSIELVSAEK